VLSTPGAPTGLVRVPRLADVERLDLAVYAAIAATPSPALDSAMGRLTQAADHSKLWFAAAFPSGHGAAAFAAIPLRALASVVAYSRVHTGVHYPSDVIAGALVGVSLAELTGRALRRRMPG
jgi:membrane-associated phospholipid phosphatase